MAQKSRDKPASASESISISKPEEHTEHEKTSWCDLCYDESAVKVSVEGFCQECNSFLCKPCLNAHKKSPASRNHVIKRGERMPQSQADKPVKYPNCIKHIGMIHDQFCLDHSEMVCRHCIETAHPICKTIGIPDLCKDMKTEDVARLKVHVADIEESVKTTKSALENNITDNELQRKQMVKEIHTSRDMLIAKAEKLCSSMVSEVTNICNQRASKVSHQLLTLSDLRQHLKNTICNIDKAVNTDVGINLFIRIQDIITCARHFEKEICEMKKELKKSEMSFSINPEISTFIAANSHLGEIRENISQLGTLKTEPRLTFPALPEGKPTRYTKKPPQKNISQILALKLEYLNVKTAEDTDVCKVEGMAVTSNGTLIITDLNNRKIKVYSPKYKFLSALSLPGKPYDVTVLNDTKVVATIDQEKQVTMDISDPSEIHCNKSVPFGYLVTAMTTNNDNLVVIRWNEPRCVKMVTIHGKELWSTIYGDNGQKLFKTPYSVASTEIDGKPIILVTDWGKDTLTLLDANNGNFVNSVDLRGLSPRGLAIDSSGNIYICCSKTAEICALSPDLKERKIILSRNLLQPDPMDIMYNDTLNELLVSYRASDKVDRFKL